MRTHVTRSRSTAQAKPSTIFCIADWFIAQGTNSDSGDFVTHLKLQKLLYYAQAWHLAIFETELFEEDFEAWAHGPVVPEVYQKYKQFSFSPLTVEGLESELPEDSLKLLKEVNSLYGSRTAKFLEDLTHNEKPWLEARGDLAPEAKCNNVISKSTMMKYYKKLNGKG